MWLSDHYIQIKKAYPFIQNENSFIIFKTCLFLIFNFVQICMSDIFSER